MLTTVHKKGEFYVVLVCRLHFQKQDLIKFAHVEQKSYKQY